MIEYRENLNRILMMQKEALRLSSTLAYYQWLEENGIRWDQLKGIRNGSEADVRRINVRLRRNKEAPKVSRAIDYLLKTGETKILPWPPFDDAVIYNRSYLEAKDGDTSSQEVVQ